MQSQAPPLPHHPQPHFYRAPTLDFNFEPGHGERRALGDGYCCVFDTLASAGDDASRAAENVILIGSHRAILIYKVGKDKLDLLGRLDGLRGDVVSAKVLPCSSRHDPLRTSRPLIALIIHGPKVESQSREQSRPGTSHSGEVEFDPSGSTLRALAAADVANSVQRYQPETHYQTTVEIYSLRKRTRVATLYRSPPLRVETPTGASMMSPPLPVGDLSLQANGRFVIVVSGTSGEVYVFEAVRNEGPNSSQKFRCLAKTWTAIPPKKARSWSSSSASSEGDSQQDISPTRTATSDAPVVTLSHRWLAIVPPTPSSRSTIHGQVDITPSKYKPPGLTSHTAPSQPPVTCELDIMEGESILNKVARDVTQEFMKGARWVGDHGMQAWKNYWNRPAEANPQAGPNYQASYQGPTQTPPQPTFPPTHAHDERTPRVDNRPILISILDLEKLSASQDTKPSVALQPVATFAIPLGCSFLSFSPSGLHLLTASAKGDVQHVWDLKRAVHVKAGLASSPESSLAELKPTVRQIVRSTRMTVANIVDVIWTIPRGERFAVVTDRGTVHIFDLPPAAFRWPPPRPRLQPSVEPGQSNTSSAAFNTLEAPASKSVFGAAINMVNGNAQPLLAAVRGRPSISNPFGRIGGFGLTAGASAKGGKVVAAGLSKSVGAAAGTVNNLRFRGENRLHVPGSAHKVTRGCVRWLSGKDQNSIAVTGGGILRIHGVRESKNSGGGKRRLSVLGGRPLELKLPDLSEQSTMHGKIDQTGETEQTGEPESLQGFWSLMNTPTRRPRSARDNAHPLSHAEIDTAPPYQPFHTDRRIHLHLYDTDTTVNDSQHLNDSSSWVFGEPIPTTRISVGSAAQDDETASGMEALPGQMENLISLEGNEEGGQQLVVTTRRKRGKKGEPWASGTGAGEEEEIFEDDYAIVDYADERV